MADIRDGEYMISSLQWGRQDAKTALRPVRGFTSGKLNVEGGTMRVSARFNDQNLSNRFSDLEEDETPIVLQIGLFGEEGVYQLPCASPTLERGGASYVLRGQGQTSDAKEIRPST